MGKKVIRVLVFGILQIKNFFSFSQKKVEKEKYIGKEIGVQSIESKMDSSLGFWYLIAHITVAGKEETLKVMFPVTKYITVQFQKKEVRKNFPILIYQYGFFPETYMEIAIVKNNPIIKGIASREVTRYITDILYRHSLSKLYTYFLFHNIYEEREEDMRTYVEENNNLAEGSEFL